MRIQSTELASGGGINVGGTPDALSVTGDLAWGTIVAPTGKVITVSGDGSGTIATGSLQHTGDTDCAFLRKIDGVTITWGSGPQGEWDPAVDGDYYFAMDEGQSKTFEYFPRYVDGTAQSMTVNVLRGDQTVDDTVVADHTFEDPIIGAASVAGTLLDAWVYNDLATGVIADTGVAAEDALGVRADCVADLAGSGSGTMQIMETSPPALGIASLSKYIRTDYEQGSGGANRGYATAGTLPAAQTILFLFRVPNGNPNNNSLATIISINDNPSQGGSEVAKFPRISTRRNGNYRVAFGDTFNGQVDLVNFANNTSWLIGVLRRDDSSGTDVRITSTVGGATLGNIASADGQHATYWTSTIADGFQIRGRSNGGSGTTRRVDVGLTLRWSDQVSDENLQDVIDEIVGA